MSLLHNSSVEGEINTKAYSPEQFWFTPEEVFDYRKKLINDQSEWIFLYSRDKVNDKTWKENGGSYFSAIANSEWYSSAVTAIEEQILWADKKLWKRLAKRKYHIELWPGVGIANKVRRIIYENYLRKTWKKYIHIGRDASSSITDQCAKEYSENKTPWLTFANTNTDWRKKKLLKRSEIRPIINCEEV
jgi:hypothetical protein